MQTAAPVAEKLDPYGAYLPYKLFRESTRYANGKVVKASPSVYSWRYFR
jgi:import inner membrane translocase subunit TIM50